MEVNEKEADPPNFDLIHRDSRLVRYPLNLRAIPGRPVHQDWLTEIRKYAADVGELSTVQLLVQKRNINVWVPQRGKLK